MSINSEQKSKLPLILDSNIIQYAVDKYASRVFVPYLQKLYKEGYVFYISPVTIYELLKGATMKKEREMLDYLHDIKKFSLSEESLITAAQLETLYRAENIDPKQVETGDKFIAAAAILTKSLIITANARDFPFPFFQEIERKPLLYNDKRDRSKCILICILQPDIEMINRKSLERQKE